MGPIPENQRESQTFETTAGAAVRSETSPKRKSTVESPRKIVYPQYEELVQKNVNQLYELAEATTQGVVHGRKVEFYVGKESKGVTVWGGNVEGSSWGFLKARTILEDNSADVISDLLYDGNRTSEYDDMADNCDILEYLWDKQTRDTRKEVRHVKYKAVWPTSARDFVIVVSQRKHKSGHTVICSFSITHPDRPPVSSYVRADLLLSGYLIKEIAPGKIELTMCSWIDLKGHIPGGLLKSLALSAPLHMLSTISSISKKEYKEILLLKASRNDKDQNSERVEENNQTENLKNIPASPLVAGIHSTQISSEVPESTDSMMAKELMSFS